MVCDPLATLVESQLNVNVVEVVADAGVSVVTNVPSTNIASLAMPSLSDTETVIGTVPLTVEPPNGDVIETFGGVLLFTLFCTIGATGCEFAALFSLSIALALNWCWPSGNVVVSTLNVYGETLSVP